MALEDFLIEGESVQASVAFGNVSFVATDRRVIRYESVDNVETFIDLPYHLIISISSRTERVSHYGYIIAGVAVLMTGLVAFLVLNFRNEFTVIGAIIGIGLIIVGLLWKEVNMEFAFINKDIPNPKNWNATIGKVGNYSDLQNFVRTVRANIKYPS